MDQGSPQNRRVRRFYNRYLSGVQRGGSLRFLTLTSAPDSPKDIHKSFRAFTMRCRRRFGVFEYICVRETTKRGYLHLHIVYRGTYMPQPWVSRTWEAIHGAPIVFIVRLTGGKHNPKDGARYLVKYLRKEIFSRYWMSWSWIYRGWRKVWKALVHYWYKNQVKLPWQFAIQMWRSHLKGSMILTSKTILAPPPPRQIFKQPARGAG